MELDQDLLARQEARALGAEAEKARQVLCRMPQEKLDAIVEAVARAFLEHAEMLARMAVEETGFGNPEDKTVKNRFAGETVARAIRGMRCVGLLEQQKEEGLWEIGVPVGVIAAIVPSTNPTSTVCYKALIALKAGNAIVFSPHPKARGCTLRAAEIVAEAARKAGAPAGSVGCLSIPSMDGCRELMALPQTRLILATGGPGMVRAAYSSGKPAIGVGAGNGPAYIHRSADPARALEAILRSKTFDNGTVCASEQSIILEKDMEQKVLAQGRKLGYYFLNPEEAGKLGAVLFRPSGALNPQIVGRTAPELAEKAGFTVPAGTRILVAREQGVGASYPFSMEKLCPVLALYVMDSEEAVLEKSLEILSHEGSGHTFSIHCTQEDVIRRFGERIPVSRFLVNTPAALGGIGATTGLFPALTLGCGAVGGSSSSNNISPMDLINIRRIAWDREEAPQPVSQTNAQLVELLAQKIMERLG